MGVTLSELKPFSLWFLQPAESLPALGSGEVVVSTAAVLPGAPMSQWPGAGALGLLQSRNQIAHSTASLSKLSLGPP